MSSNISRLGLMGYKTMQNPEVLSRIGQHVPEIHAAAQAMIEQERKVSSNGSYSGAAVELPWLPGYVVKLDEGRVQGGRLLWGIIQMSRLHLLRVPMQYSYTLPDGSVTLSISEKVEGIQGPEVPLDVRQAEELTTLIRQSGYPYANWRNLVHCSDSTIAITDTKQGEIPSIYGLHTLLESNALTPPAKDLVQRALRPLTPYQV